MPFAGWAKTYRNQVLVNTSPFGGEVTPHYLRHTYSTDIYAAGVDDKAQKYFLGHASGDVTDIYREMSPAAFARALRQINEYNPTQCYWLSPEPRSTKSFSYCVNCPLNEKFGTGLAHV